MRRGGPPLAARLWRLASLGLAAGGLVGVPSAFQLLFAEPSPSVRVGPGTILDRAPDGLFHAQLRIGDRALDCLVDTGATHFTLSNRAAPLLDHAGARASGRIVGAAGAVRADRVLLGDIRFAGRRFDAVPAVLVHHAGTPCLIGQDLLSRFDRVEQRGGQMALH